VLPRSTRERLLPLLLVGALLLCHGAFGSLHQFRGPVLFDQPTVKHQSHQEEPADGHALGAHDYAAALFALLVGMVYVLLRREARIRGALRALRRVGGIPTTETFRLPYGPSPPLLQVFQL
jgi:hypothetical protein